MEDTRLSMEVPGGETQKRAFWNWTSISEGQGWQEPLEGREEGGGCGQGLGGG